MADKLKVYIAAPWVDRAQAREARDAFVAAGIEVTSNWLDIDRGDLNAQSYDDIMRDHTDLLREEAQQDLDDVRRADALVIYNTSKSEGKATELGYSLAFGMPVVLVGERIRNIFYVLPEVYQVDTTADAITFLKNWNQGVE